MQLTCKVNQAEAIRRGFDANSTVKLEVNPANLTPEERATLADNFKQGHIDRQIPEPTVEGFLEDLRGQVLKAIEAKAAAEQRRMDQIFNTRKNFSSRTARNFSPDITANLIDGEVALCERYAGDDATRVNLKYTRIEPCMDYGGNDKEWECLMETPAGIAWQKEIDTINSEAKAKAETAVIAAVRRRLQHLADKALELEDFRQWALAHGSDTLRLRAEEGFTWQPLAEGEWADYALKQAGVAEAQITDMPGYDQDSEVSEQPTASQIRNLRRIREALTSLRDVPTEVTLRDFTYTEEVADEYNVVQDPEVVKRTEVCVDITTPTGKDVTRYFQA